MKLDNKLFGRQNIFFLIKLQVWSIFIYLKMVNLTKLSWKFFKCLFANIVHNLDICRHSNDKAIVRTIKNPIMKPTPIQVTQLLLP